METKGVGVNGGVVTLSEAVRMTVDRKRLEQCSAEYVRGLRIYLSAFAKVLGEATDARTIETEHIEGWFSQRKEAPATQASNRGRLSAMFAVLKRAKIIASNPCDDVYRPRVVRGTPTVLTVEQARLLMTQCRAVKPHWLAYLTLCLFCGLRPREAAQMQWSRIDLAEGTVTVDALTTKTRRRRCVHIRPAAAAWLSACDQSNGIRMGPRQERTFHLWSCAVLGLAAWPQDVLRHTAASMWVALERDVGKVAFELGNSPAMLYRHYIDLVKRTDAEEFWGVKP